MPQIIHPRSAATQAYVEAFSQWEEDRLIEAIRDGADITDGGRIPTPLMRALDLNLLEAAEVLFHLCDLTHVDELGWSVLTSAAAHANLPMLKAICAVDDPGIIRHSGGVSAFMCAAESGQMDKLVFLIDRSDIHARDCFGLGALEFAAKGRSLETIDYLLSLGLSTSNPHGPNALMIAVTRHHHELSEKLLPLSNIHEREPSKGQTVLDIQIEEFLDDPIEEARMLDLLAHESDLTAATHALQTAQNKGVDLPQTRARIERIALEANTAAGPASKRTAPL